MAIVTINTETTGLPRFAEFDAWAKRICYHADVDLDQTNGKCLQNRFIEWGRLVVLHRGEFLVAASKFGPAIGDVSFALVSMDKDGKSVVVDDNDMLAFVRDCPSITRTQLCRAMASTLYLYGLYAWMMLSSTRKTKA
jgi:hypothetical protein